MNKYLIGAVIVLALLGYMFFRSSDDTSQIEALFNEMIEAAANKDPEAITDKFSLHYKDDNGASYPVIKNIIKKAFEKFDTVGGSYENIFVTLSESADGKAVAVANIDIEAFATKSGVTQSLMGRDGDPDNITVTLEKSTLGGWKITKIEGVENIEDRYW